MSIFDEITGSHLTYCIGWTLIHTLWQGALIAVALELAWICLRESSPQSRYLAACLAKTCQLMFLVGTLLLVTGSPVRVSSTNLISESASSGPASSISQVNPVRMASAIPSPSRTSTQPEKNLLRQFFERLDPAIPWIGFMWCCGFLALSFWNLGGLVVLYRLKTAATCSVDRVLNSTLAKLLIRMQVGRKIKLLQSACAESPFVIGVIRPVIVFPTSLLTQLSPEQIEAILIHELAHICRHDYLVNLFQVVIDTILFYHPATWWISTRIRSERENCCDDIVVKTTAERDIYIAALAVIAESRTSLAPAASSAPLLHRIRRLLGVSDHRRQYSFVSMILVSILLVVGIIFSSQRLAAQVTDQKNVKTRTVVVWKVGPPIRYDGYPEPDVIPDELITRSAELNIQLKIKVLPSKGIVSAYAEAKATGDQPDILSSYDFSLLDSLPDGKNGCTVEGSLETLAPVSLINIFPSSPNYLAAKELALSYPTNEEALNEIDPALEKAVLDFAKAHSEGDVAGTTQLLDPAVQKDFQGNQFSLVHSRGPYPVESKKKICSVWQGEHIAIVQSMAFSEMPNFIGCDTVTSIFEGKRGDWKLVDYVAQDLGSDLVRDLTKQIGPLSGKQPGQTQEPVLISPADGSSVSPDAIPPKLEWRHDDENVEAYLVELQVDGQPGIGHSGKGTWCTFPIRVVRPTTKGQILSCAGPGRGVPPHRWRVWAIYGDGSVSISGWRTFYFDW